MAYAALACRALIGLVFAVSAFSKIRNIAAYRQFTSWLASLPVPLAGNRALPPLLAAAEAAIVVLVAVPAMATPGLALAALTLAALTAGTAVAVHRGTRAACRCFGTSRAPLSARHVLRNALLFLAAVTGLAGTGAVGTGPTGITLSLMAALAGATFVVFLDDLAFLTSRAPAGGEGWAGLS